MKPDGFKRAGPFARVLRVEPTFQMPLAAPAGFVRKWSRDGRGSNFVDFCRFTILLIQTRSIFPSADVFLFRKMMITLRHWNCFPIFSQAHLYIETDLCWANLCPSVGRRLHRHRAGRALDHAKEGIVGCLGKPVFFSVKSRSGPSRHSDKLLLLEVVHYWYSQSQCLCCLYIYI